MVEGGLGPVPTHIEDPHDYFKDYDLLESGFEMAAGPVSPTLERKIRERQRHMKRIKRIGKPI